MRRPTWARSVFKQISGSSSKCGSFMRAESRFPCLFPWCQTAPAVGGGARWGAGVQALSGVSGVPPCALRSEEQDNECLAGSLKSCHRLLGWGPQGCPGGGGGRGAGGTRRWEDCGERLLRCQSRRFLTLGSCFQITQVTTVKGVQPRYPLSHPPPAQHPVQPLCGTLSPGGHGLRVFPTPRRAFSYFPVVSAGNQRGSYRGQVLHVCKNRVCPGEKRVRAIAAPLRTPPPTPRVLCQLR